jgi:hypothetical protein
MRLAERELDTRVPLVGGRVIQHPPPDAISPGLRRAVAERSQWRLRLVAVGSVRERIKALGDDQLPTPAFRERRAVTTVFSRSESTSYHWRGISG